MNPRSYLWQHLFSAIDSIEVHRFVRNGGKALHVHDYFEFILVVKGKGQFISSDQKILLATGNLLIVPPGVLHSYSNCHDLHMLVCSIRSDMMGKIALWTGYRIDLFGRTRQKKTAACSIKAYSLPSEALRRSKIALNGIVALIGKNKLSTQVARLAFLFDFLSEIIRIEEASPGGQQKAAQIHPLTVRALELLHDEGRETWDLASLSRRLHQVHPVYLGRVFKRDMKMSPMRYLRRLRCQRAASGLSSSDLPIGEVAFQAGWADPNLFARVFGKEMGMTPTQYRISSRAGLIS